MQGLMDVARRLVQREPDLEQAEAIEDVLDAARAFVEGKLPWWEAARIGPVAYHEARSGKTIDSTAYARYLAVVFTPLDDPRRAALLQLVDVIVEQSGVVPTNHGLFDRDVLHEYSVTVRSAA